MGEPPTSRQRGAKDRQPSEARAVCSISVWFQPSADRWIQVGAEVAGFTEVTEVRLTETSRVPEPDSNIKLPIQWNYTIQCERKDNAKILRTISDTDMLSGNSQIPASRVRARWDDHWALTRPDISYIKENFVMWPSADWSKSVWRHHCPIR